MSASHSGNIEALLSRESALENCNGGQGEHEDAKSLMGASAAYRT